ncbi:alpha-ketoglutarate-dependent dioxygenase AlkB family protein [Larsenimonas suaedae]|uniref:alpha-ketoglutarate-dependent dioxygenase AlkB family protein n=1 Tax=Larsenimonas suaedae TaxID=1851019 RepID=UPI0035B5660D
MTSVQHPLPDWPLWYFPKALPTDKADHLFKALDALEHWQQPSITLYGKTHPIPRTQIWMGADGADYTYSNQRFEPSPWHPSVRTLARWLTRLTRHYIDDAPAYNSVLLNRYQDGQQRMGWHSDDEPELGNAPIIASLSLGAARPFRLRGRAREAREITPSQNIWLAHGSVLLMGRGIQTHWQHALLPRAIKSPRINLTFRHIFI